MRYEIVRFRIFKRGIGGVFFLLLNLFIHNVNAQWQPPCQDTLGKNIYFQCDAPFRPVCGCDFKTYRNDCASRNIYGINTILSDGVCKNDVFYFDVNPNPSTEKIMFDILFFEQVNYSNYTIQIFDLYGKLMYFEHKSSVKSWHNEIYLIGFRPGIYIFTIISGNIFRTKKIMVK